VRVAGALRRALVLVPAAAAVAAAAGREEPASRMKPVYDHFSHRVAIEWDDVAVALRLPSGEDSGNGRTIRLPGWPVPQPQPLRAPLGVVGVGVDGSLLINTRPEAMPRPRSPVPDPSAPFLPPRGPGPLRARVDLSALVGVLLDGFPLYGPLERDGETAGGLDECGGHVGLTPDSERAIYHYHVAPGRSTICGCLRGTPLPDSRR